MSIIRQGDVCLVRVGAIPKGAIEQPQKGKKLILALGEATGHHHRFEFHGERLQRQVVCGRGWGAVFGCARARGVSP